MENKTIEETKTNEPKEKEEKNSSGFFTEASAIKWFPFLIFLVFIAMVYIGNRHFAEKNVREIDKLNRELKELRSEYMTNKAELMYKSNQTELAKSLEITGIKESKVPPIKIVIKDEY